MEVVFILALDLLCHFLWLPSLHPTLNLNNYIIICLNSFLPQGEDIKGTRARRGVGLREPIGAEGSLLGTMRESYAYFCGVFLTE